MIPGRVSVLIPARNEPFLGATVRDVLVKARGEVEVLVCLDGYWPEPPLPDDPRLTILHKGDAQGMRPAINHLARMARGEFLCKCDAHVMFDEGFDVKLKADYHEDNWLLIPRRYALNPEAWVIDESQSKYPVDYHFLSSPFHTADHIKIPGLHGSPWTARRDARLDIPIDDEMSSQGSCWFMSRTHWERLGEMDSTHLGNFICEMQEIGLKTWLNGGAMKIDKHTWYAHLYKGHRGRGYALGPTNHQTGTAYCAWYWMTQRTADMQRFIGRFMPVPTWPVDLDAVFHQARQQLKNPYQEAA